MDNSSAIYLHPPIYHFTRAAIFQIYARAAEVKGEDSSLLKAQGAYEIALALESMAVTMMPKNDVMAS
jgi:hypothetical protein